MNKFKTCRELLLLSYADNNISDEEFVPLYDCYRSKNPDFGYQSYDVFYLENMNSADCKAEFRLTQQMKDYNKVTSEVRVSVEWLFGDIINSFKFLDHKKNLKIGLSSVRKMYIVCALLRNAITCLHGNQTSAFFDLEPPTLEEYFQ